MYSTYNERNYVAAERFIRTLKNSSAKYMTSIFKNMYIDKLHYISNKYNTTYHSTIKMKPVDVKWSTYIDIDKNNNTVPWTYVVFDLKDIMNPYSCLLKKANFSIKISNE